MKRLGAVEGHSRGVRCDFGSLIAAANVRDRKGSRLWAMGMLRSGQARSAVRSTRESQEQQDFRYHRYQHVWLTSPPVTVYETGGERPWETSKLAKVTSDLDAVLITFNKNRLHAVFTRGEQRN